MARTERPEIHRRVGRQVKLLREQQQLTQEDLAERAGISASHLPKIEAGQRGPSLVKLEAIARALDVPVAALLPEPFPPRPRLKGWGARETGTPPLTARDKALLELIDALGDLDRDSLHDVTRIVRRLRR